MNASRREFLKGTGAFAGFAALAGCPVFAAPAGGKPPKKPNLVFGILTDTHYRVEWNGVTLWRGMSLDYVRNAFKLFKARNIDAFLHLGDAAHRAADREIEFHRELFEEVFGKSGSPAKLLVPGNHEWFDCRDMHQKIWANDWQNHSLMCNFPRLWGRAWGVKFEEMWHKEINGYHFFGRDWNVDEMKFADFILSQSDACSLKGKKPFFILSHRRHHFGFCHALREYPNAVAFFGHWHQSNADWKSIYFDKFGGFFPSIECGACRFDGGNSLDANESVLKEQWGKGGEEDGNKEQDWHSNKVQSRQAMVVNIYDDFVVFERHEVGLGGKLGPDWVLPLKWREKTDANGEPFKHPFSRDMLTRRIGAPEFAAKAVFEVKENAVSKRLCMKIPLADGNEKSRVFAYDVVVIGDDPKNKLFKSVYFEGCNLGIGHEPDHGVTTLEIPKSELPEGKKLTIAVRPISSLGTKGKPLVVTYSIGSGSVKPRKV